MDTRYIDEVLIAAGFVNGNINERQKQFLTSIGFPQQINEAWYWALRGIGGTGSLPDMFFQTKTGQIDISNLSWGNDFVMTVETTGTPETFTIPAAAGVYNAVIDWGDGGATSTITSNTDPDLAHSYATPGIHTIRISGSFPYIIFNNTAADRAKVRTVEQMGRVGWTEVQGSFYGCSGMTKFVAGNTDLTGLKVFTSAWRGCSALTECDLSGLWANGVIPWSLNSAFWLTNSLTTLDLSGFDFSQCGSMSSAFRQMTALTTLLLPDNAVTTACTTLDNTFYLASALETFNTTGWDTSAVTTFNGTLRQMGTVDVDISGWRFDAATVTTTFATSTTLATTQYDAALIEWDGIDVPNSLSFDFGTSKYTGGGAATAARAGLVATDLWVITDGGIA